jgi:CBS domain-containing protein
MPFTATNLTASDVMTSDVATVTPDSTIRKAAQLMLAERISGLPVVDPDGKPIGFVSEVDLVRPDEAAEKRADWWLNMLADGEELSPEFLSIVNSTDRPVAKVMHPGPVTVTPLTPLKDVATLLAEFHIKRVLVVDEAGKLAGVVGRHDLVRSLLKR